MFGISLQRFGFILTLCLLHLIPRSTSQLARNIAINKQASESNQYAGRAASYAVDGNTITTNTDVCATTTPSTVSDLAWWQVDLGDVYLVNNVTLYPADTTTGDGSYLKNCNVYVSNDPVNFSNQQRCVQWGDPFPITVGQSYKTFNCTQVLAGRFIRVMKTITNQPITLCEFMATGSVLQSTLQGNVALNKPARLGKPFGGDVTGRLARYAVDGSTLTSDLNRCAMGDDSTNNNWLQVDLGDEYVVTSIKLFVQDSNSISNSNIYIGDTSTDVTSQPSCAALGSNLAIPSGGGGLTINCTSWSIGRYVTIWKNNPGEMLTVCELFVSGYQLSTTTTTSTTTSTAPSTTTTTASTTPFTTTTTSSTTPSTTTTTTSTTPSATSRPSPRCDRNCRSGCTNSGVGKCDGACVFNFGLSSTNTCVACDQNCLGRCAQSGGGKCDGSCTDGYSLNSTNICIQCDRMCRSGCSKNGRGKCDGTCECGFGMSATNTCVACDRNCQSGCAKSGGGKCDGFCYRGYSLNSTNTCIPCDGWCRSGCTRNGAGKCDSVCMYGYGLTSTKTCVACDRNCLTGCDISGGGKCDGSCSDGYSLSTANTCIRSCK